MSYGHTLQFSPDVYDVHHSETFTFKTSANSIAR